jgi:S1-C subfamily serine protease
MQRKISRIGLLTLAFVAGFLAVVLWARLRPAPATQPSEQKPIAGVPTAAAPAATVEAATVPEIPAPARPDGRPLQTSRPAEVVGIGATLQLQTPDGLVRIVAILPDSPAARAGLAPGWVIQKVDGMDLAGLRLAECVDRIRGPIGTKVRLELVDLEQESTNILELTRQKLKL